MMGSAPKRGRSHNVDGKLHFPVPDSASTADCSPNELQPRKLAKLSNCGSGIQLFVQEDYDEQEPSPPSSQPQAAASQVSTPPAFVTTPPAPQVQAHIPDELWFGILSHCDFAESHLFRRVCKHFDDVLRHQYMQSKIEVDTDPRLMYRFTEDKFITSFGPRAHAIKHLDLSRPIVCMGQGSLQLLAKEFTNLEILLMEGAQLQPPFEIDSALDAFWEMIESRGPLLKQLHLPSWVLDEHNLEDERFRRISQIGKFCPNLEVLRLPSVSRFRPIHLTDVVKGCPSLEELSLSICQEMTTALEIEPIVQHCPRMKKLSFPFQQKITDLDLIRLSSLPELQSLTITSNSRITSMVPLARCTTLRSLNFSNAISVNFTPFLQESVLAALPELRSLQISTRGVEHRYLRILADSCPMLEELSLTRSKFSDSDYQKVCSYFRRLRSLSILEPIFSTTESIEQMAVGLEQSGIKLTSLKMLYVPTLVDDGMKLLAPHLGHLEHLSLTHCSAVAETGLAAVILSCGPRLKTLNLDGNPRVTASLLRIIAKHCPCLRELSLRECLQVTDEGVIALSKLSRLERVDLSEIPKLTNLGPQVLAQCCNRLRTVLINGNNAAELALLQIEFPWITWTSE